MLNFPTFPTTFCLFTCWVPPSLRNGDCATTIFAANGGTLLCTRQVVLSRYPWIQETICRLTLSIQTGETRVQTTVEFAMAMAYLSLTLWSIPLHSTTS